MEEEPYEVICARVATPVFLQAAASSGLMWGKVGGHPHWPVSLKLNHLLPQLDLIATWKEQSYLSIIHLAGSVVTASGT